MLSPQFTKTLTGVHANTSSNITKDTLPCKSQPLDGVGVGVDVGVGVTCSGLQILNSTPTLHGMVGVTVGVGV